MVIPNLNFTFIYVSLFNLCACKEFQELQDEIQFTFEFTERRQCIDGEASDKKIRKGEDPNSINIGKKRHNMKRRDSQSKKRKNFK